MATSEDFSPQERAALVTWHLAKGETMSIEQIADMTGLTPLSVRRLMEHLCRVLPLELTDWGWRSLVLAKCGA